MDSTEDMLFVEQLRREYHIKEAADPEHQFEQLSPAAQQTYVEQMLRFRLSEMLSVPTQKIRVYDYCQHKKSAKLEIEGVRCKGVLVSHDKVEFHYIQDTFKTPLRGKKLKGSSLGFGAPSKGVTSRQFSDRKGLSEIIAYEQRLAQCTPGRKRHMLFLVAIVAVLWLPFLLLPWLASSGEYGGIRNAFDALAVDGLITMFLTSATCIVFNTKGPTRLCQRLFNAPSVFDLQATGERIEDERFDIPCTLGGHAFQAHLARLQCEMGEMGEIKPNYSQLEEREQSASYSSRSGSDQTVTAQSP